MIKDELLKQIKINLEKVAPEINFEKINFSNNFRAQVEIDSYDMYRFLLLLESTTQVKITETSLRRMQSLEDLVNYILDEQKK